MLNKAKIEVIKKLIDNSHPFEFYGNVSRGIKKTDLISANVKYYPDKPQYKYFIDSSHIYRHYCATGAKHAFLQKGIKSKQDIYKQEKICVKVKSSIPIAALVPANIYTVDDLWNLYLHQDMLHSLKYILAVIQSSTIRFYWLIKQNYDKLTKEKNLYTTIRKKFLLNIPIPNLDIETIEGRKKHDKLVFLIDQIYQLSKCFILSENRTEQEKYKFEIAAIDKEIDLLVYQLFNFTQEEIKVIEGL